MKHRPKAQGALNAARRAAELEPSDKQVVDLLEHHTQGVPTACKSRLQALLHVNQDTLRVLGWRSTSGADSAPESVATRTRI